MSLEELRAQAEAEEEKAEQPEAEEPEQEEADEPETEQEETEEPEAAEAEESEDFELELEGESTPSQQKPDPIEVLQHKLGRKNRQKKKVEEERDSLKEELEQIKAMLKGQQPQPTQQRSTQSQPGVNYPQVPLLYEKYKGKALETAEEYNAAYQDWMRECREIDQRHAQAEQAQNQNRERFESMTKELASRAAKFASENKVSVDRVADALDKATSEIDEATKIDGALAYLLDSVGDGSERVAYYIGTNDGAMSQIKGLLRDDPQGFKAIAHMTRLAEKLRPKHSRKVSKAPEPDQPLRGDSSKGTASAKKVQDLWDKAKTPKEMLEARKKARELGVKLDT